MAIEDQPREDHDQEDMTEEHSFDELAKGLADGTISRRRALKMLAGALFGGSLLALIPGAAEAASQSVGGGIGGGGGGHQRRHHHHHHHHHSGRCPSGTTRLCNGTCAIPCDPRTPESCGGGCVCISETSGAAYCGSSGTSTPCTTSCDCPTGQFCEQIEPNRFCVVAC
jgi:hypothetical protein